MTKDEWKQRREIKDSIGVDTLRKTIKDYEDKLCELHKENYELKENINTQKQRD